MRAFRLVLEKFGADARAAFSGLSGHSADGRWHAAPRLLDYAAESRSLAALERLVHYKRFDHLAAHRLYEIQVPDSAILPLPAVPAGWNGPDLLPAAQAEGNRWCDGALSPALLVPSAVTPGEHNLLINARHPDWRWSWVDAGQPFSFDQRLVTLLGVAAKGRKR